MKWLGLLLAFFGFALYASLHGFEGSLPLVQFVDGETILSAPMHAMVPPGTVYVKGSGENGAKFVDIHSDAAKYLGMAKYLGLAKLGALGLCLLGGVGFAFEQMRAKARREAELTNGSNLPR